MTLGGLALLLGLIGLALPLMPTAPFVILAAFFFARGHPPFEEWLLRHRLFGPAIVNWRERRAIGRRAKIAATIAFAGSAAMGFYFLEPQWAWVPAAVGLIAGSWIWSRPD